MEILELHLKHYGKFTDYRLKLHAGVNIISGGNETGKSTLHSFIRAMLYGISRNRSRNLDEYQLRQPWENPEYFAGAMRLIWQGKVFRIERNFSRKEESVQVICETDAANVEDTAGILRAFTGGMPEADFDNTFYIRQAAAATSARLGEHLRDCLVNIEQTGDSSLDVNRAQEHLKKKRRELEQEKAKKAADIDENIRKNLEETEFIRAELQQLAERRMQAENEQEEPGAVFERLPAAEPEENEDNSGRHGDRDSGGRDSSNRDIKGIVSGERDNKGIVSGERDIKGIVSGDRDNKGRDSDNTDSGDRDKDDLFTDGDKSDERNKMPSSFEQPETGESDEDERLGWGEILIPVLALLCFAAGALLLVCGFRTDGGLPMYGLYLAGGVILAAGFYFLYRVIRPLTAAERRFRQIRRRDFLERKLGFREDPEDPAYQEQRRKTERELSELRQEAQREKERERRVRAGQASGLREEREKELQAGKGPDTDQALFPGRASDGKPISGRASDGEPVSGRASDGEPVSGRASDGGLFSDPSLHEGDKQGLRTEEDEKRRLLSREKARGKREEISGQIAAKNDRLNELSEELEGLYRKKAELRSYEDELAAVSLASRRITELSDTIYRESGAQFSQTISGLISALTEGRYDTIRLDERMQVQISTRDHLLQIGQVSYGTMEQIYFALRMAAGDLLSRGESLPLVLDEAFSMYDDERLETALRFLYRSGRQVILFSCQRRELDILAGIRNGRMSD